MAKRIYDIKPISVTYRNIQFRSTLEARWAVFFDCINWDWIYEENYFKLPIGNYLPDFYFPHINAYGEVKPNELTKKEYSKCCQLSELFKDVPVLLLIGQPTFEPIQAITNGGKEYKLIPISKDNKFYPFFTNDIFIHDFIKTDIAIIEAIHYQF